MTKAGWWTAAALPNHQISSLDQRYTNGGRLVVFVCVVTLLLEDPSNMLLLLLLLLLLLEGNRLLEDLFFNVCRLIFWGRETQKE